MTGALVTAGVIALNVALVIAGAAYIIGAWELVAVEDVVRALKK